MPRPVFEIAEPFIKLSLAGHAVVIDSCADEVFIDGDKLNLGAVREYESNYCRAGNKQGWQKRRVKVIDVGGMLL